MRKPNLFIIGAAKCGTTSLHDFLAGRPDVFMSEPKEPGFFVPEMDYHPKDEDWYLSLFREAGDARIVGESSTHYSKLPLYAGVPPRIADYSPDARIIYLMRDPVERAISHYWFHIGKLEEKRPILRALKERTQYIHISDYAMQLDAYFREFDRRQILPVIFEELVREPAVVLKEILEFLGVGAGGPLELPESNVRPQEIRAISGFGILRRIAESSAWEKVAPTVPKPIRRFASSRAVHTTTVDEDRNREAREYLRPILREKVAVLSGLLGRSFPIWKTTLGHE